MGSIEGNGDIELRSGETTMEERGESSDQEDDVEGRGEVLRGPLDAGRGAAATDGTLWPHAAGEFSMAAAQANLVMEDQAQVLASTAATLVERTTATAGPTPPGSSAPTSSVQRTPTTPSILRPERAGRK
jgi:hypothetical protein